MPTPSPTAEEIVQDITTRADTFFGAAFPGRADVRDSFLVGWISGELIAAIRILQSSKSPEAKQFLNKFAYIKP